MPYAKPLLCNDRRLITVRYKDMEITLYTSYLIQMLARRTLNRGPHTLLPRKAVTATGNLKEQTINTVNSTAIDISNTIIVHYNCRVQHGSCSDQRGAGLVSHSLNLFLAS